MWGMHRGQPPSVRAAMRITTGRMRLLHSSASRLESPREKLKRSRSSVHQFPASFVLPTTVPEISRLTSEESSHRRRLVSVLNKMKLPQPLYAFAYGSGVFSQAPKSQQTGSTPPMIDMIIAVQNPEHWHARNMQVNPHHYPWWTRWCGEKGIRVVQRSGAGLWYVPYVKVGDEGCVRNVCAYTDYQVRCRIDRRNVRRPASVE